MFKYLETIKRCPIFVMYLIIKQQQKIKIMKTYTFEQAAKIFKTERINNRLSIIQKGVKYYIDFDIEFDNWSIITFSLEKNTWVQVAKIQ